MSCELDVKAAQDDDEQMKKQLEVAETSRFAAISSLCS